MTAAASNFSPAQALGLQSPIQTIAVGAPTVCAAANVQPSAMTDAELEQHIQDCGHHMLEAMANNNRQEAEGWLQAQTEAIKARSAAQVARMEAERGLGPSETFVELAERDLPAFLRRQAA